MCHQQTNGISQASVRNVAARSQLKDVFVNRGLQKTSHANADRRKVKTFPFNDVPRICKENSYLAYAMTPSIFLP